MKKPEQNISSRINDFYLDYDETLKMSEVACKDCKTAMIDPKLLECWTKLRKRVGQPITINSGYRCWDYHVKLYMRLYPDHWREKITKHSKHLVGQAFDLDKPPGMTIEEFINLAKVAGFTYCYIISPTAIHVDVRGTKVRWDYR